jgi:hypothetical protein
MTSLFVWARRAYRAGASTLAWLRPVSVFADPLRCAAPLIRSEFRFEVIAVAEVARLPIPLNRRNRLDGDFLHRLTQSCQDRSSFESNEL